jgi:hypothetical protein
MRTALVLLCLLVTSSPVLAQFWTPYQSDRLGYAIDIPPGYEPQGEIDDGEGTVFVDTATTQVLTVRGGPASHGFEAEVRSALVREQSDAWNITAETITPQWAWFTAIKGMRVLYVHMIAGCDGAAYAGFRLDYLVTDRAAIDDIIEGLVPTLQPPSRC